MNFEGCLHVPAAPLRRHPTRNLLNFLGITPNHWLAVATRALPRTVITLPN